MTTRVPQCVLCEHLRSSIDTGIDTPTCAAFPRGIPDVIFENKFDHRETYIGDGGTRWEPVRPTTKFPEWAMADADRS